MKISVTGISGYLGELVSEGLKKQGHQVSGIKRQLLYGTPELLSKEVEGAEIIINLAGAPILQRWTPKNKQSIYESRVKTTQNLVQAILMLPKEKQPRKFISASAIGIYQPGLSHDESSTDFEAGFVGQIVTDWENATKGLPSSVQKIIFRIGPVLGKKAKTITKMLLPFQFGLGATIGNGQQPFPFIHEKDVVRVFLWAVEEYSGSGIFNLVAPQKITNAKFTKELARQLHRPAFLFIPGLFLKLIFGKAATMLVNSPEITSQKLISEGFSFEYPNLEAVLSDILQSNP